VLYEWAADLERSVSSCIDSFSSSVPDTFLGYDTIYCLHLLQSGCITFEGKPVASRSLLMLDNIDRLTRRQRRNLFDALFTLRVPVGIWLAERLKALTPRELFSATLSREYGKPIVLEEFWKSEGKYGKYEKTIANIADRRARLNAEVQTFETCLESTLDSSEWQSSFSKAMELVAERVQEKAQGTKRYDNWIDSCLAFKGTAREKAINWRILEIKIERNKKKT
jgi:hypothetical protein